MIARMALIAFVGGAALLAGCTGGGKTPVDTLVVALGAAPATLDPRFATDATGMRIGDLIFQSLVHVGSDFKPAGDAAESWSVKGHTYTFRLQPDLTFHNGRPATPEDILFSFTVYQSEKSPFAASLGLIKNVQAHFEGARLIVELELKHLSDKFLINDLPIVKILPKAEVLALGSDFSRRLIGTGAFRFSKIDLNEIRLEGVRAGVKYLKFKVIRDDFTRAQKLLKGEVDLAQAEIPSERVKDFEAQPKRFQVWHYPGLTMTYVLLNFRDPLLRQKAVREALARSLQRDEIIRFKLNGLGQEATSLLTPNNPYYNASLKNPVFALAAAQKVIAELKLKGQRLTLKTSNQPAAIDNGKVLVNQLSRSGLAVELESYEWATFYADVKKGAFQLATMKWVGTVDPEIYHLAFHSSELPPGRNRGAYNNPQVDQLLEEADRQENPVRRREIFLKVQQIVQEDIAILPLWYDEQVAIAGKNVLNFKPSLASDYLPLIKARKQEW